MSEREQKALVAQAIHIWAEVRQWGWDSRRFERDYLNGWGDYERKAAAELGIEPPQTGGEG